MGKVFAGLYSLICYTVFFLVFLYLFGFAADLWVPKSVSYGGHSAGTLSATFVNLGLILLFGLQHSVMARPTFKSWWKRFVPFHLERSTFVLATNLVFIAMYVWWRPLPQQLWNLEGTIAAPVLWAIFGAGIVIALLSSFMINHFDLFGLRQAWLYIQDQPYSAPPFVVRGFYKKMRNPLMFGLLLAFWAAPVMTYGRLLFASAMTVYIVIGIYFEERNIAEHLGADYIKYKESTSMIFPLPKK